jgi:uncharacterized membrane protein YkoI
MVPLHPFADDEDTAVYDPVKQTEIRITRTNSQQTSHNITLRTPGSQGNGILSANGSFAEYDREINMSIEDSSLFMEVGNQKKQITILPDEAISLSDTAQKDTINKLKLTKESDQAIYRIESLRKGKVLFVWPVSATIETKINAENGSILSVKKPWWLFLVF